ncbi:competence type IV pilus major pilin ComGC [Desulfitobacterium metallireducens]|uniref:N-terminal cleavage protein n=1 Tax=Desulfitobacterium metallireducens DSM 15288 TaxID=871968 RepID=W0E981_9FIRM|nr:type II secretion system protein GspG [Desulfitobacterium metallireducens]AHF07425.1 N-terminal cleavage protein [Desulfitobacterium metallireducens DSM 15288]
MRRVTKAGSFGFTLLEVLLALAILGMIMAQVVPKYGSAILSSNKQVQQANQLRIEGAVELYRLDTGSFPSRLEDLLTLPPEVHGWRGPYLDKLPTQPDGRSYTLDSQGRVGI